MRDLFHVPERYFLSHSVGCLPKTSQDALNAAYFTPWAEGGGNAWPSWLNVLGDYRSKIASLLGTGAQCICPQTNISSALTKIIYSLPRSERRNEIVLSPQDFPTNGFIFKQAERSGYKLKFVTGDITNPEAWNDAVDGSTAIVHITHALSNTSQLLPAKAICEIAHQNGAKTIVDIAQSAGVVLINLRDWKTDFAIGTGVKFLCCGPGACFLYASESILDECVPLDVGWFSHENPFEMDINNFRYASDAMKFFGGTPSPAPYILANESLSVLQKIGHENTYQKIQKALSYLAQDIPDAVMTSPRNPDVRGATLVLNPNDRAPLRSRLTARNILHDERKEGFRFSVHGYTPHSDLEDLRQAVSSA